MTEEDVLRVAEPRPGIVQLTLNRPDRLNALTPSLLERLDSELQLLERAGSARVVVLGGTGRAFCAGFDLDEIAGTWSQGIPGLLASQEVWVRAIERIIELPMPVIAAVDGPAVGAGMSLALAADVRVATPRAHFEAAFVRIGLSGADLGLSWSLPRVVGMGLAAELMLTGRQVDGHEAVQIGMANRLCESDDLVDLTFDLAAEIAANSPFGVRLSKQALHAGVDASSFRAAAEYENRNQLLASRTEDMAEALAARRESRHPVYQNR